MPSCSRLSSYPQFPGMHSIFSGCWDVFACLTCFFRSVKVTSYFRNRKELGLARRVRHYRMPDTEYYQHKTVCGKSGTWRMHFTSDVDLVECQACRKKLVKMGLLEGCIETVSPDSDDHKYLFRLGVIDKI